MEILVWHHHRPPPHSVTHRHKYTNSNIIFFLQQIFIPFIIFLNLFLIPCSTDARSGCQFPSWLQKQITNIFFILTAMHRFIDASSPAKQLLRIPLICSVISPWIRPSPWSASPSNLHYPNGFLWFPSSCAAFFFLFRTLLHLVFITICLQNIYPSWWVLSSRSLYRHFLLFSFIYLSSPVGIFLLHLLSKTPPSPFLHPSALFWHSYFSLPSSPLALFFVSLSPGYLMLLLSLSLSVFKDVSHLMSHLRWVHTSTCTSCYNRHQLIISHLAAFILCVSYGLFFFSFFSFGRFSDFINFT